jgi:gamma-glutamylcyclotransferase (GGCT)/AIG2-like uncharacterized protein YtfP
MTEKLNSVLVYGTLRPFDNTDVVEVAGHLYDLGWYPGIVLKGANETDSRVKCERIHVTDEKLAQLDRYEGYDPRDRDNSLYLREKLGDCWIYVYNKSLRDRPIIESGDWEQHSKQKEQA